ncbi:MAG: helix-turn-helix domain-containing protein [Thiobacillaceae bacterium]
MQPETTRREATRFQPLKPLLTRRQAAEYLGVKEKTLAQWATAGRYGLPYIRVGRKAMYRQSDLDAFIERNVVGGEVQQ